MGCGGDDVSGGVIAPTVVVKVGVVMLLVIAPVVEEEVVALVVGREVVVTMIGRDDGGAIRD